MPAPDFILRDWNKQQQIFLQNLAVLRVQIDSETIHRLRVSIKKLRAYLKLYAIISGQPGWKSNFNDTERLFSILGKYRDVEMNIHLLEMYEKDYLTEYALLRQNFFANHQISANGIKNTLDEYDSVELKNMTTKLQTDLSNLTNEDMKEHAEKIIRASLKKANHHLKNMRNEAHNVRKLLKEVFYWIDLYPADLIFSANQRKKLNKILDGLGNWQDNEVFLVKVKHFRQDYIAKHTTEYSDLKKLEALIKNTKNTLLNDVEDKINAFMGKNRKTITGKKAISHESGARVSGGKSG